MSSVEPIGGSQPAPPDSNTEPSMIQNSTGVQSQVGSTVGAASTSQPGSGVNLFNMEKMKETAPELYKALTESIARQICNQQKRSQERIKKLNRENAQRAKGG
jgi:hypothetical protein